MMIDQCGMMNGRMGRTCLSLLLSLIILHSSLLISSASAQLKGEVESIGFENYYRPDCWTQMVIRLTPETDKAADYLVCVHQQDMDRDLPIYARQVTVTPTDENGNAREQRFRVYFKPKPTDHGLPDASEITTTVATLQKDLTVDLTTTGGKFVAALPITNTIFNLNNSENHRECKFVLTVTGAGSVPPHREYDPGVTIGFLEDIAMVPVAVNELPENPIGYDAVDAILWLDASPDALTAGGDERLRALQNYVRGGGHLVICQQTDQWQKTLGFADMLPVSVNGIRVKGDAEPLRSLAANHERSGGALIDPWDYMRGPMTLGVATIKPGAYVDQWITWPNYEFTPYLARKSYGCGCVTWVAQNLADRSLASTMVQGERMETIHWPAIWNRIFDWKDDPLTVSRVGDADKMKYSETNNTVDIGHELNDKTMELNNKSLWYITVAVIFFIVYWLVAGPGTFFFLLSKGKSGANWFAFAAAALVFTLLTVLLVDVIVRGAPDLRHFSVVRATAAEVGAAPVAHVYSRFGLYIPKDGKQTLEIKDSAPGTAADLSAYAIPPKDLGENAPSDIGLEYTVPITDAASGESTVVQVPYRRTLKKLEAGWTGDPAAAGLSGGIEGTGKLVDGSKVEGKLTNGTGRKLRDVYFAYKWRNPYVGTDSRNQDYLVYIPEWGSGVTIDLAVDLRYEADKDGKVQKIAPIDHDGANPENGHKCSGSIQKNWEEYWLKSLSTGGMDESTMELHRSLIVLSLFDRLMPNQRPDETSGRVELFRRGARHLDCSAALAAGSMVVVAGEETTGPNPLPMPLEVNGDRVTGDGLTLYQFIVPMDNSFATTPTTQPE
jgi:hypothetical protein